MILTNKAVCSSEIVKESSCNICIIFFRVSDTNKRVEEMVNMVSNTSWLTGLKTVEQVTFTATSKRTIENLVKNILIKNNDKVSEDLGEYIISCTAQDILVDSKKHQRVPLAELLKEKLGGNPGFDFHTETETKIISFGEAKYNSSSNSYGVALEQIAKFIELQKDEAEFTIIQHFVSPEAMANAINKRKAYCAAFSLHSSNHKLIIKNILESEKLKVLFDNHELYLIGVEISA